MIQEEKQERFAKGLLGAFLGSLLGVGCILLISRLGYVSALSGVVMALFSLKGYERFAGALSKKGAFASIVLVLVMTWLANQLDFAISIALSYGIPVWEVFLAVPALLREHVVEGGAFWGNLVLLYLFTLLGAVPVLRSGLTGSLTTRPAEQPMQDSAQSGAQQAVFYPPVRQWAAPMRKSGNLAAVLELVLGLGFLIIGAAAESGPLMIAGVVVLYCAILLMIVGIAHVQDNSVLLARIDGVLWRFHLTQLNNLHHFTNKKVNLTAVRWYKLTPEERQRAQQAALRVACPAETGAQEIVGMAAPLMASSPMALAGFALYNPELVKETKWGWKLSYETESGKRRKVTLYKIYPGFAPLPGVQPAEGPVPMQWSWCLLALGIGAVCFAVASLF